MRYPRVLTEGMTIAAACDGMNIGRFGDGELKLALRSDAKSQRFDVELQMKLRQILDSPTPNFLACIPNIAGALKSPKEPFWAGYRGDRYARLYNPTLTYGSAFISRPDSAPDTLGDVYFGQVANLWRGRDVVVVGGSGKSLKADDLLSEGAATVEEVECPRQHAWDAHGELLERLKGERRRVFLCCGATATVLAWELAAYRVHAVDLGHIAMFLRKARSGQPMVVTDEDRAAL